MFTAATVSNTTAQDKLISSLHDQLFTVQSTGTQPFPALHNIYGAAAWQAQNAKYVNPSLLLGKGSS